MQICGSNCRLFLICFWLSNDDVCNVSTMNSFFFQYCMSHSIVSSCIHCWDLKTIIILFSSKFLLKSKFQPMSVSAHRRTVCYGFSRTYTRCISGQSCQCSEWQQRESPTIPNMVHTYLAVNVWTILCVDSNSYHARHS